MRFVIIGGGRVGLRTAEVLRDAEHDVAMVEWESEKVERARDRGIDVVHGDGSQEDTLIDAKIEDADALGALTGDLNTNFVACMIAHHHNCRTVLRIDEDYREEIYRKYASEVDEIVYPERLGAIAAMNALLGGDVRAIVDVAENLQVLELKVTSASPMLGYSLEELELPGDSKVLAFAKEGKPMGIGSPEESMTEGDRLAVLADFDVLDDVRQIIVGEANTALAGGE